MSISDGKSSASSASGSPLVRCSWLSASEPLRGRYGHSRSRGRHAARHRRHLWASVRTLSGDSPHHPRRSHRDGRATRGRRAEASGLAGFEGSRIRAQRRQDRRNRLRRAFASLPRRCQTIASRGRRRLRALARQSCRLRGCPPRTRGSSEVRRAGRRPKARSPSPSRDQDRQETDDVALSQLPGRQRRRCSSSARNAAPSLPKRKAKTKSRTAPMPTSSSVRAEHAAFALLVALALATAASGAPDAGRAAGPRDAGARTAPSSSAKPAAPVTPTSVQATATTAATSRPPVIRRRARPPRPKKSSSRRHVRRRQITARREHRGRGARSLRSPNAPRRCHPRHPAQHRRQGRIAQSHRPRHRRRRATSASTVSTRELASPTASPCPGETRRGETATYAAFPFQLDLHNGQRVRVHVYPVTGRIEEAMIGMDARSHLVELKDDALQLDRAIPGLQLRLGHLGAERTSSSTFPRGSRRSTPRRR